MDGCWGTARPTLSHLWPPEAGHDWQQSEGEADEESVQEGTLTLVFMAQEDWEKNTAQDKHFKRLFMLLNSSN